MNSNVALTPHGSRFGRDAARRHADGGLRGAAFRTSRARAPGLRPSSHVRVHLARAARRRMARARGAACPRPIDAS